MLAMGIGLADTLAVLVVLSCSCSVMGLAAVLCAPCILSEYIMYDSLTSLQSGFDRLHKPYLQRGFANGRMFRSVVLFESAGGSLSPCIASSG